MSISTSWIAVQGMGRDEVLTKLGAIDTGQAAGKDDAHFSCADMPDGWFVVLSTDFNYPSPERMVAVSAGGRALACSIDERVMYSVARGYEDGRAVWSIDHDGGSKGIGHLDVAGRPPPEWPAVRDQQLRTQAEEGDAGKVDYVFNAPADLVCTFCGFRADGKEPPGGWPEMTVLEDAPQPRGGLFKAIAGLFGRKSA